MAVTDEQLDQIKQWAYELGRDGVLNGDIPDNHVLLAALDMADTHNMRTEDEFNAVVTLSDIPDGKDQQDIIDAFDRGWKEWDETAMEGDVTHG